MGKRRTAWGLRYLAPLGLTACFAALALATGPAVAQTLPLNFAGTVVIRGGGQDGVQSHYTGNFRIGPGSAATLVLSLPVSNSTLRISGPRVFGESCGKGSDCLNTDICADGVCGWSGLDVSYLQCGNRPDLIVLDKTLDDCVRLWAVDNPANLSERANVCMQIGAKLYGSAAIVSGGCPQLKQYRDAYDLLLSGAGRDVLMKAIRQAITTPLAETIGSPAMRDRRVGDIKAVLGIIDTWFRGEVARFGTSTNESLVARTSAAIGQFWKSVYVDDLIRAQLFPRDPTEAAAIAKAISKSGFDADRQVLRAAFDKEMPMQTAPLLLVVGDALSGLVERTESFGEMQDLVCSVRPCFPGDTTLGNYMKVLAAIAEDGSALKEALSAVAKSRQPASLDSWKEEFNLFAEQHAALDRAVLSAWDQTSASSDTATLVSGDLTQIPVYARPFASMVRRVANKSSAFEQTGIFRPRPREVHMGLETTRNTKIRDYVDTICADGRTLPTAVANYRNSEDRLLGQALALAQSQIAAEKAAIQLDALGVRYRQLSADMNGLRASRQLSDIQFGDFMRSFEELAKGIKDSAYAIQVTPEKNNIDVSALNARHNPNGPPVVDIGGIAVQRPELQLDGTTVWNTWKLSHGQGDMVTFGFSGKWAPTCALRNLKDPNGNPITIDTGAGDVTTGPEGYSASASGTKSVAASTSIAAGAEAYVSMGVQAQVCAGAMAWGSGAQSCFHAEAGVKQYGRGEVANTWNANTSNSFSWGLGLRSSDAPFSKAPVGSLLLVGLPAGKTSMSDISSVQVLTYPQSAVVVKEATDFYLVVNDFAVNGNTCDKVSNAALNVRVTEMVPPDSARGSKGLAIAMAEALGSLREKSKQFVDQGRLLPGQREMLRADTLDRVYKLSSQSSMGQFPESLRNLFEAFINKLIGDIELEIELASIERQAQALLAEEDAIRKDIESARIAGRVAEIAGGRAARNMDLGYLEVQGKAMSNLVRDWVEPVVSLRLANGSSFTSEESKALDALISLSPDGDSDYADGLLAACKAVNTLTSKMVTDSLWNPEPVVKTVIFSIPNPFYTGKIEKPAYREVDEATANRAWTALRDGKDLDFTITPAMFYEQKEPYSLSCSLTAPVVKSMAYFLATTSFKAYDTFNSDTTVILPEMLFPRPYELLSYRFMNGAYLKAQVPILTGTTTTRATIDQLLGETASYWQTPSATTLPNKGTSPFGTYHLDLTKMGNTWSGPLYPFKNGIALLVAFQVETISQSPGELLPGVPPCQQ
jgi:hypothetical protein